MSKQETIEHVLLDCDFASVVWFVGFGLRVREAAQMTFTDWVFHIAQKMDVHSFDLFLMLVSNIWYARNKLMWQGIEPIPLEILSITESWLHSYQHGMCRQRRGIPRLTTVGSSLG